MAEKLIAYPDAWDLAKMHWAGEHERLRPMLGRNIADRLMEKGRWRFVLLQQGLFKEVDLDALGPLVSKGHETEHLPPEAHRWGETCAGFFAAALRLRGIAVAFQLTRSLGIPQAASHYLHYESDAAISICQHRPMERSEAKLSLDRLNAIILSPHFLIDRDLGVLHSVSEAYAWLFTKHHDLCSIDGWVDLYSALRGVVTDMSAQPLAAALFESFPPPRRSRFVRKLLSEGRMDLLGATPWLLVPCGLPLLRELADAGLPDGLALLLREVVYRGHPISTPFTPGDLAHVVAHRPVDRTMVRKESASLSERGLLDLTVPIAHEGLRDVWALFNDPAIPDATKTEAGALNPAFHPEDRRARALYGLLPAECHAIRLSDQSTALSLDVKGRPKNKEALFDALLAVLRSDPSLGADALIVEKMDQGRKLFGAGLMLAYMNRPGMNRHDAVYFLDDLQALAKKSGLDARIFAKNILLQVAMDGASYAEGKAHHRFAGVCRTLRAADLDPSSPASLQAFLMEYREGVPGVDELLQCFEGQGPFGSWAALRKVADAQRLLGQRELITKLAQDPNDKMRAYIGKLAFHPNIEMDKVLQFWKEPAKFLDIEDEHAPAPLRTLKKPINCITVAHLDLTASDLRDAVVGRKGEIGSALDRLQVLPPFEAEYTIWEDPTRNPSVPENLHRMLIEAMGRPRQGVPGLARAPKALFAGLKNVLTGLGEGVKPDPLVLLQSPLGCAYLHERRPDLYQSLIHELFGTEYGMNPRYLEEGKHVYRAKIGWKSDPEMVVAGNDTASCMPFGSGKSNVYMFNPNCAQMVVERQLPNGAWNTAAQSVVTVNQEVGRPAPQLVELFQQNDGNVQSLIEAEDFARPRYIACDNIEVAKNEEGARAACIAEVYRRFWGAYLKRNAEALGVSPRKIVAGIGYTPAELGLAQETNDTIPLVPMSYSDNLGQKHFVIRYPEDPKSVATGGALAQKPTVRPIEAIDVYSVAHLESKAFEGTGLGYGIHKVQNNLLGIAIANQLFGRPNLSFISQAEGKPASAYLIAYEGRIDGEKMVYVDDMAAESKGHPSGGRILLTFIDAYLEAYKNDPMYPPILSDMRDSTSFRLVTNQLERLSKRSGIKARLVELSRDHAGGGTHKTVILVGRSEEELNAREAEVLDRINNQGSFRPRFDSEDDQGH